MDIPRNMHGFPATDDRVPLHTSDASNARIREHTLDNVRPFVGASTYKIDARIEKLRREWDIERTLEANAAALALRTLRGDFGSEVDNAEDAMLQAMNP